MICLQSYDQSERKTNCQRLFCATLTRKQHFNKKAQKCAYNELSVWTYFFFTEMLVKDRISHKGARERGPKQLAFPEPPLLTWPKHRECSQRPKKWLEPPSSSSRTVETRRAGTRKLIDKSGGICPVRDVPYGQHKTEHPVRLRSKNAACPCNPVPFRHSIRPNKWIRATDTRISYRHTEAILCHMPRKVVRGWMDGWLDGWMDGSIVWYSLTDKSLITAFPPLIYSIIKP